jgi:RNA polymerase sigma-70 factor (ECF subfamily)
MPGTRPDNAEAGPGLTETLEALFADQESALLNYAYRIVPCEETAQDIVQEAFLRLHGCFATVQQRRAWLYRTVHNLAMNHIRSGRKVVPLSGETAPRVELSDPAPLPDEYLERMEAIGQARLCLKVLDLRTQALIRLKFEEGLSYQEMGTRLNLSISNVGYLLHHGLKQIAAELKKTGVMS